MHAKQNFRCNTYTKSQQRKAALKRVVILAQATEGRRRLSLAVAFGRQMPTIGSCGGVVFGMWVRATAAYIVGARRARWVPCNYCRKWLHQHATCYCDCCCCLYYFWVLLLPPSTLRRRANNCTFSPTRAERKLQLYDYFCTRFYKCVCKFGRYAFYLHMHLCVGGVM